MTDRFIWWLNTTKYYCLSLDDDFCLIEEKFAIKTDFTIIFICIDNHIFYFAPVTDVLSIKKSNEFLKKKINEIYRISSIWFLFNEELLPFHVYIHHENRILLLHYLIFFNNQQTTKKAYVRPTTKSICIDVPVNTIPGRNRYN